MVIYHLSVKMCGRGGTADALASGASGGDPVEVQILSTAPFLFITVIFNHNAVVAERQTHHLEGVAGNTRVGSNPTNRTIKTVCLRSDSQVFCLFRIIF